MSFTEYGGCHNLADLVPVLATLTGRGPATGPRRTPSKGPHTLVAYDIAADGTCKRRAVLHDFKDHRGIDGMVVDTKGNIYATAESGERTGVYIFSPAGKQLGFIRTPETATNCTFGDQDLQTLYITAGTSVYKIRTKATGCLVYPVPKR